MEAILSITGTVLSLIFTYLIGQFKGLRSDLKEIGESVKELNIKIAEVVKDQSWHKEELRDIKKRITALEQHKD